MYLTEQSSTGLRCFTEALKECRVEGSGKNMELKANVSFDTVYSTLLAEAGFSVDAATIAPCHVNCLTDHINEAAKKQHKRTFEFGDVIDRRWKLLHTFKPIPEGIVRDINDLEQYSPPYHSDETWDDPPELGKLWEDECKFTDHGFLAHNDTL